MAELEREIEQKLIDQLCTGVSQWTYRPDLRTEEDLWQNFQYILEQNNKNILDDTHLTEQEMAQIKNQLQFSSFYEAGKWLVGENRKPLVHVQRNNKKLSLVVMNHEAVAGGTSVYEVINQYRAFQLDEDTPLNRRFDVTLLINGLPMIHIELKNKQHSYKDGFWQIKSYADKGMFTGIFSTVQMFVVSNGVNTKYFSANRELNPKFMSSWCDEENKVVGDYLDFANKVLKIPMAHEMISKYTVLDEAAKRLILLRPYQVHAIEAIRSASKSGKSGYIWHTTGSGKTLTSYKATRNLIMDIPSLHKTIFLIDRKDLDSQTTQAFKAYANHDVIDVDETNHTKDLRKKLKSKDRQVIVTTIQKLQRLIAKAQEEGGSEYDSIKQLKIAFVVDECHRAVSPGTKRELERFFTKSMWYGFTGTPRFSENAYEQKGDLPRTTEELYGNCLHKYTIESAIKDEAVLGFQVEYYGANNDVDANLYKQEAHMLKVIDTIVNKSYYRLGFVNGKGQTYSAILTTSSIAMAQKYYDLLKRVKRGETDIVIDERIKQVLPDFPKFAITYSLADNQEKSEVNESKMAESLADYNAMFGTRYSAEQIGAYNENLNKRLARKDASYKDRHKQLDVVIVVDRLLTGFDAPCLSTVFIDRPPMNLHDIIQTFSRTNRIFDKRKTDGHIVTFQSPEDFKEAVDTAISLYSAGGTTGSILAVWAEVKEEFKLRLSALRVCTPEPRDALQLSLKEKKVFVGLFSKLYRVFTQLRSFSNFTESMLEEFSFSKEEYEDYEGHYSNIKAELKELIDDGEGSSSDEPEPDLDYELVAYKKVIIDHDYIISLIQNIIEDEEAESEERERQITEIREYIESLRENNPKLANLLVDLVNDIAIHKEKYQGKSVKQMIESRKMQYIDNVVDAFCATWCASQSEVKYAALHFRQGRIVNESVIKETGDFRAYKEKHHVNISKIQYRKLMIEDLRKVLSEEVATL